MTAHLEVLGIHRINGEDCLSTESTALLLGITPEALRAEWARQQELRPGEPMWIPKGWIRQGKEINARLGVDSIEEALTILRSES
jgi:hypothetical protein